MFDNTNPYTIRFEETDGRKRYFVAFTDGQGNFRETEVTKAVYNGRDYVVNKNTKKFHYPSCSSADDIKASNRWDYHGTREELINMGYVPCKRCHP